MGRVLIILSLTIIFIPQAEAVIIDWASVVSNANAVNADWALGRPDGMHATFGDSSRNPLYATYSGFGSGDSDDYNLSSFSVAVATADFFTAEFNGGDV